MKLVVDKTFKAHYVIIHLEMKVDMFFKSSISSPYFAALKVASIEYSMSVVTLSHETYVPAHHGCSLLWIFTARSFNIVCSLLVW